MNEGTITQYVGNIEVYAGYAELVGSSGFLKVAPVVSDDAWELVYLEVGDNTTPVGEVYPDGSYFVIDNEYTHHIEQIVGGI